MAYDEASAARIRALLFEFDDVTERKMFGGLAFMINGHMTVGLNREDLMVRVGAAGHQEALTEPYARPMDFTGRAMKGFVFVSQEGYLEDHDLAMWIHRGVDHSLSLAPKSS